MLIIFLLLVLCMPSVTSWTSKAKVIDLEKAQKQRPVILITDAEREFFAQATEYCLELKNADQANAYIYPNSTRLQSLLDAAGINASAAHSVYMTEYGLLTIRYYDVFHHYELSGSDEGSTVTKTVSIDRSPNIGILHRDYTYINTENKLFEKHTHRIDLWETFKNALKRN